MKKKLYTLALVVSALFGAQTITAQEVDITPAKFKFTEMALGACPELIEGTYSGPNPPNSHAPASTPTGYIMQGSAPAYFDVAPAIIASGMSIVDGGELGNILMFKGRNSKEERGVAASGAIGGFWSLSFYASNQHLPKGKNVRVSFKMKCVAAKEFDPNDVISITVSGFQGATIVGAREAIYLMDKTWYSVETDFIWPDNSGTPRFKLDIPGWKSDDLAFYISDIRLIENPTGDPNNEELPNINDTPTSTEDALSDNIKVIAQNGTITVEGHENEVISIYSIAGSTVKQAQETANYYETSMPKGVYLVKVANKTVKVIL
ncbi:MAG: DUF6383 domain-containing protein [Bacteroidales bacterium]